MRSSSIFIPVICLVLAMAPVTATAMCIPFFCEDCELRSQGQLNFVVMNREDGLIRLIPNIRLTGIADEFALLVPTPSEPTLEAAGIAIWDEAFRLTAAAQPKNGAADGLGCGTGSDRVVFSPPGIDEDVTVVRTEMVGDFVVEIVEAGDADALVAWLNANRFSFDPADAEKFAPYIEAGWVFNAMHLAPGAEVPDSWDTGVEPVVFTFAAAELEIPLPLLSIHRAEIMPMSFFVVDDHRADLPNFRTVYANRLENSEFRAIERDYPEIGRHVQPGDFLTRLDRTFDGGNPMDASVFLVRANTDDEFRRTLWSSVFGSWPAAMLGFAVVLAAARRLRGRGKRTELLFG